MNFASVICVGATGKPLRVASFAHAAAGSGGGAARLADAPKLAADTPTNRDPTIEIDNCRRCCFMPSSLVQSLSISCHELPSIGGQGRARDEAGVVGGEEQDAARDLLGLAEAPDRDQRQDRF